LTLLNHNLIYELNINTKFPSTVKICNYGKCLISKKPLKKSEIVQEIRGKIVPWDKIPESEICYVILIEDNKWMTIDTDARYLNHSCDPNCIIDDELNIITVRSVKEGEELTISYNIVNENENPGPWDPKWTFKCECGSINCQGIIDKYVTIDGRAWYLGVYKESEKIKSEIKTE
jgi:hypothetical protein